MAASIFRRASNGFLRTLHAYNKPNVNVPVRHLNLLEYQSKVLLENHGVTVQRFKILDSHEGATEASKALNAAEYVVKAQILAGGRGKGHFDNGFKGGVHLTKEQKEIFAEEDTTESDPREVEAASHNLSYIGMDGSIGCLVNGAGLAMATMDIIKLHGGSPANFLDLGGGVNEDQVQEALRIVTSDTTVKAVFVNIFGGIVNCATIASGLVKVFGSTNITVPTIVRLEGTNVIEARRIIKESGCNVFITSDFEEAAKNVVAKVN
ncbi:succinate--CoA ligase [GDP-forming] subunit beta, mitochondrial-like [Macrobrachium nipponense]|uniref:succinate--CoA ligase [GDP-forming] subunit beta, mitochondrial-like n=1 Tax=Macrobrachium nipponense TaxID=159736 RepID=UPI0030C7E588